jgi:hypothetical protein
MSFRKAERKKAKLRLALCGPSGSGKTYSALLIAQGLAHGGRVAMLDTERGSGELYADLTGFDVAGLAPPFEPAKYIAGIEQAERAGYSVLIIDSLSHAWAGEGGILDLHDKAAAASRSGNSFAAWREVTPQHNALVDAMLQADLHVIATMRTKTAYDVVDDNGKKKPIKVGLAPVQRDGLEYEFTAVFDLSVEGHIATAAKDRTRLFDGKHWLPVVGTGERLRAWLESGAEPVTNTPPPAFYAPPQLSRAEVSSLESPALLDDLRAEASMASNMPALVQWWRTHEPDIARLSLTDHAKLTAHCATLKAAFNAAMAQARLKRAIKGNGAEVPA